MALPIFQRTVTNSAGDIIVGAEISVFDESTGLVASIFSNRDGTTPLTNPFFTGSDGLAQFYAQQGEYRITASSAAGSVTWRYEPLIGTLDEGAAVLQAGIYAQNAASSANAAIDARDAAIGAANYKGNWEGKTGAGAIGESYLYKASFIYRLNANLANLSTSVPSPTNTDWVFIQEVPFEVPCKPALDLDFANQDFTIYDKLGGFVKRPLADLVSQGRATAGSSDDAIGGITEFAEGENRFTFDGETGEALGYLSESASTNIITYSDMGSAEAQSSGVWDFAAYDEEYQSTLAPDGTMSGLRVSSNGVASVPVVAFSAIDSVMTFSIYLKPVDSNPNSPTFLIRNNTIANNLVSTSVNLQTGAVSAGWISRKRSDGWIRLSITLNTDISSGDTIAIYIGSAGQPPASLLPFYMWGCQFNDGGDTTYIKTLGVPAARLSDSMTRNLGQEYNPAEGTFVIELNELEGLDNSVIFSANDGTADNYTKLYQTAAGFIALESCVSGVITTSIITSVNRSIGKIKCAIALSKNSAIMSINGESVSTSALANAIGLYTQLDIAHQLGSNVSTVKIADLPYYPRAFDALTLQRLSRIQ